jgi:hypothetical protein
LVSFSQGGKKETLETLADIDSVEVLPAQNNNSRFRINYKNVHDGTDIFQLAVKNGWVINELSPQSETLEQIFMKLIHSDAAIESIGISDE